MVPEFTGISSYGNFAEALTLLTYVPIVVSLLAVSSIKDVKTEPYNKAAIVFISAVSIFLVVVFSVSSLGGAGVDVFSRSIIRLRSFWTSSSWLRLLF